LDHEKRIAETKPLHGKKTHGSMGSGDREMGGSRWWKIVRMNSTSTRTDAMENSITS
jgi:hypothetical protein